MLEFLLTLAALPTIAIGLLLFFHVLRPQKGPADSSNRINKIRLIWFALNREDLFVDKFPWLKNDELENMQ